MREGAASERMALISLAASRQLTGNMIAPTMPQAKYSSKWAGRLRAMIATRSPTPTPIAMSASATRSLAASSSPKLSVVPANVSAGAWGVCAA